MCDEWIEKAVDPYVGRHAAGRIAPPHRDALAPDAKDETPTVDAAGVLQSSRGHRLEPAQEATAQAFALIGEVAHNAAVLWSKAGEDATIDVAPLVAASLEARATGIAKRVLRDVARTRARLVIALGGVQVTARLSRPGAMPIFVGGDEQAAMLLRKPVLAFLGVRWIARRWRNALVRSGLDTRIAGELASFFEDLGAWHPRILEELQESFAERGKESPSCSKTTATPTR